MRHLVDAIVHIAPRSARTAATLLKALRHRDIRAVHCPKNTWFMRDRLEDELHANLAGGGAPASRGAERQGCRRPQERRSGPSASRPGDQNRSPCPDGKPVERRTGRRANLGFSAGWSICSRAANRRPRRRSRRRGARPGRRPPPKAAQILEPGLLVLQPEALPHLLDQLREAKSPASTARSRALAGTLRGTEQGGLADPPRGVA